MLYQAINVIVLMIQRKRFQCTALYCFSAVLLIHSGCQPSVSPAPPQSPAKEASVEKPQPLDVGELIAAGDFSRAEAELKLRLLEKPNDSESLFWMANLRAAEGRLQDAVQLLEAIPASDVEASIAAAGQSAQWLEELQQWDEAVRRYKVVLAHVPDSPMVLRPLARILNRQGRRLEAVPLVAELCRQGNIEEAELRSLITWSHAFASDDPKDPFASIGLLAKGRYLFSLNQHWRVIELLKPVAFGSDPAVYALYGRSLAILQDWEPWSQWQDNPVSGCENHADYWYARGLYALSTDDPGAGAVFFSEAIMRDPTDPTAYVRYSEALARVGMQRESSLADQRAGKLRITTEIGTDFARNQRDVDRFTTIADLLESLGRPYEAIAWRAIALEHVRASLKPALVTQLENDLRAQRQRIVQENRQLSELDLLFGVDRDQLKKKFLETSLVTATPKRSKPVGPQKSLMSLELYNVASDVHLVHAYDNTIISFPEMNGMLQELGSGIAVIDFDLDGRPDIYLPQGAATPMQRDGIKPNLLYRNLGDRFEDVTVPATADDRSYSQGATAGDINQDGLPDLCIANVGQNILLINKGDGTFADTMLAPAVPPLWSTSLAIGDITGDYLPDIFEINYIDDPIAFERHASPTKFNHAIDRVHFSNGAGEFITENLGTQPFSGLGLVMTDFDGDCRNEVFVANDGRPDQFWMRVVPADGDVDDNHVRIPNHLTSEDAVQVLCNRALERGCSVGFQGFAGASMGIAADDFNMDGRPDLFVTQYYNEPDVFYLQTERGSFVDRAVQMGTYEPSMKVLGFGAQSIDLDNDSFVEIAVLNGHTSRASDPNIPYEMLPQIYRLDANGRYLVEEITDESNYWHTRVLGRGLSKLDWNRDGRVDLVAVHVDVPTALVENRTASDFAWLELRLVGTISERDAIGASVIVEARDLKRFMTITSGDGFCGKNESVLHFGLAESESAQVHIQWPSGKTSEVQIPKLRQRWLIVEGDDQAHDDGVLPSQPAKP